MPRIGFTAIAMWCISRPNSTVGVGVARRVAAQLAARLVGIGPGAEVVAVVERRDGALERQDLEPVPRQVEVADDLGPQQAHDVGEHRELEAREDLLGHRGAADQRAPLEHQRLAARARQVGRGDQAVVAAADDDRVVAARSCLLPLRIEERQLRAPRPRPAGARCSTVISICDRRARLEVRRPEVRQRQGLLEQRRPAAARGVADLLAVAVDRRAGAPRHVRELRRQAVRGVQRARTTPSRPRARRSPTPAPRARSAASARAPVERPLVGAHRPAEVDLERRGLLRLDQRVVRRSSSRRRA